MLYLFTSDCRSNNGYFAQKDFAKKEFREIERLNDRPGYMLPRHSED
jgi:hypothetical protein